MQELHEHKRRMLPSKHSQAYHVLTEFGASIFVQNVEPSSEVMHTRLPSIGTGSAFKWQLDTYINPEYCT